MPKEVVSTVCEPIENKQRPANSYDAQFSIPYLVATALLRGRFSLAELEQAVLSDPAILALAQKVDYEVDANAGFPKYFSGELIVTMKDGREFFHREHQNRGCADRPLTMGEIRAKFSENVAFVAGAERSKAILRQIEAIETCESAVDFGESLAK